MLTSTTITGFDPRGVRYQARLTHAGGAWMIDVETLPSAKFLGPYIDAVSHAQSQLERAIRSGVKPTPNVM